MNFQIKSHFPLAFEWNLRLIFTLFLILFFPFAWKAKRFAFSPKRLAFDTIQLFDVMKGNLSTSLFCFWKRGSKGEFPKDNLVNAATCLYAYFKIDIQQLTKTCRKWHDDIRTNSPCCNSLLWTSFLFLTG